MISLSFLTSFITIRFEIAHLPKEWLGLIGTIYSIGMTLGSFKSSRLISKLGFIRSYIIFAALIGFAGVVFGFTFHPPLWAGLRFLTGYALGAIFTIIESWIIINSPENQKGKAISLYGFVLYLGYGLAPYLFQLIPDLTSLLPLIIISLLAFLAIFLMTMTKLTAPPVGLHDTKLIIKEIFQKAPIGFTQCLGSGIMNVIVYVFFPKIMYHHPHIHFTYLLSVTILGGVLFQYPLGLLSDYYNKRKILIGINIAIAAILPLCMIFFNTMSLFILLLLLGGGLFAIYSIAITYTSDSFPKKAYFSIVQTLLLIYGIGCILGPMIVTFIFLNIFPDTTAIFIALFVTNALLLLHAIRK